jgi:DNA-directed RNA polymerase alpha subunit
METDGSLKPKEALESALKIMITQFKSILDLKELEETVVDTSFDDEIIKVEGTTDTLDIDEDEKVELLPINCKLLKVLYSLNN